MEYIDPSSPEYAEFNQAKKTRVAGYFPHVEWPPGVEPVGIGFEHHLYVDDKGDWYILECYHTYGGVAGGTLYTLTPAEAREVLEGQGLQTHIDRYFPQ